MDNTRLQYYNVIYSYIVYTSNKSENAEKYALIRCWLFKDNDTLLITFELYLKKIHQIEVNSRK